MLRGRATIDTESFLTVYRENDLQIEELDCPIDDIWQLARELADTSTSFAKTVMRLAYRFDPSWLDEDEVILLEGLLSMLDAKRTLEYLHLAVPTRALAGSHHVARIRSFNEQELPAFGERFPITLSRGVHQDLHGSYRAREERDEKRSGAGELPSQPFRLQSVLAKFPIDYRVLSMIFDFAATCIHRLSYVTMYSKFDW